MPAKVNHDPDAEEIRRECAKIRRRWSKAERQRRIVQHNPRVVVREYPATVYVEKD